MYCIRFSIVGPSAGGASSQPIRQPVIAQFFDSVWTNRILSSGVHDVVERGRALALVGQPAVDFVGDDPEAVPAREIENGRELLARRDEAGRIGRRIEEDRARRRRRPRRRGARCRAASAAPRSSGTKTARRARQRDGAGEIRPRGRGDQRLLARPDRQAHGDVERLHAADRHEKRSGEKRRRQAPRRRRASCSARSISRSSGMPR